MFDPGSQRLDQLEDLTQYQRLREIAAMHSSMTVAERLRQAEALCISLRENLHG
jgi:hypothetical protein